jgi:uncharacterized protein (DUF1697 family)
LRGINVGSSRNVPMAQLCELCPDLGLERPQTYIQSGNLIVDAGHAGDTVRDRLEQALRARFGFSVDVVVRTAADWESAVAANPFSDALPTSAKLLHLYLCRETLRPDAPELLRARARAGERVAAVAGALFILYGSAGVGNSKLTPAAIDTACGSPTTGRNWNSVASISELIRARTPAGADHRNP